MTVPPPAAVARVDVPVTFLYTDDVLAIVDKPPGVPVIPAPGSGTCLRDRAATALGQRLWVVHRLDRDTSGVLVFARSAAAHRALSMAFEARDVQKRYSALLAGVPEPMSGVVDVPLHEARRGKARPARRDEPGSRDALTRYAVACVWRDGARVVSRVMLEPRTGRHHQIRVHMRSLGTPLLGDSLYGRVSDALAEVPVARVALHATAIDVPHPASGQRVIAEAPWPVDLVDTETWLSAHWTSRT